MNNTSELLIVEDLLLLLLDNESGVIAGEGTLMYTLGGAVLAELALDGKVETEESGSWVKGLQVHAVAGDPPTDPLLGAAYEKIAEKPRGVQELLVTIGADLRGQVIDRLLERGLIRRETKKVLGLFRTTRLPAQDLPYEAQLLESVRTVLEDGREPDARAGTLVALLSSSGTLPQFHRDIPWSGKVYQRGKELEAGNWGAAAVGTAVSRTTAAIAAASAVAVSTAINAKN